MVLGTTAISKLRGSPVLWNGPSIKLTKLTCTSSIATRYKVQLALGVASGPTFKSFIRLVRGCQSFGLWAPTPLPPRLHDLGQDRVGVVASGPFAVSPLRGTALRPQPSIHQSDISDPQEGWGLFALHQSLSPQCSLHWVAHQIRDHGVVSTNAETEHVDDQF